LKTECNSFGYSKADIGIIMLDTLFPRIPGDIGNPDTFPFPVRYEIVQGASPKRVVKETDELLIEPFRQAALRLARHRVKAVAAGCGFLAAFQRELADAVDIPVFSSSLLQVPMAHCATGHRRKVGILTASAGSLKEKHLRGAGIQDVPMVIVGMEEAEEFTNVFIKGKRSLDRGKIQNEMIQAARKLSESDKEIGAVVLECTNMPPYANAVQKVLNLPVFDVVTMIQHIHNSLKRPCFPTGWNR
jgi:glutamate racemase